MCRTTRGIRRRLRAAWLRARRIRWQSPWSRSSGNSAIWPMQSRPDGRRSCRARKGTRRSSSWTRSTGRAVLGRKSRFDELPQVAAADCARLERVAVRSAPVGLEADGSVVAVALQRRDLTLPVNPHLAERTPCGLVILHVAILRVNVPDSLSRQLVVAI